MGLYDQKLQGLNMRKDKKMILIGISVFLILIVLIYALYSINWSSLFEGNNISAKFSKNPYSLSKDSELQLKVTIKNNSEIDSENTVVTIYPIEEETFILNCKNAGVEKNRVIVPIMSKNSTRIIECDVLISPSTTKSAVLEGTYSFDIIYTLNNIEYKKRTTLGVKK